MSIDALKCQLMRLDNLEEGANIDKRIAGFDWPKEAETMIGLKRMNNIQYCIEEILKNNILGDFIEAGVWRGGACIFMRGILKEYGIVDRKIFVADSFKGFPESDFDMDTVLNFLHEPILKVSKQEVQSNFVKYGMLDEQVKFIEGWFKDTLPSLSGPFSLVRLDGDLYESTLEGLYNLYPKLAVGGYIIIDDYGILPVCKLAVESYRWQFGIKEEIVDIDGVGVYWKKEK
jgi:hypothetical protein